MKANLASLNDLLFEQLERINDDDLHGEELKEQIDKTRTIITTSSVIIKNAEVVLRATELQARADSSTLLENKQDVKIPKFLLENS